MLNCPAMGKESACTEVCITCCGAGVKPKPRVSDITRATARKAVNPSGTESFSLVQVFSLKKKCRYKQCYDQFYKMAEYTQIGLHVLLPPAAQNW